MTSIKLEQLLQQVIPNTQSLRNMSSASKLQLIRESKSVRQQLNITINTIAQLNKKIKEEFFNYNQHEITSNLTGDQLCQNANMVLSTYFGLNFMFKTFVKQHNLTLQDIMELDPTSLLSENISLEALSLIYQASGVFSIQVPHLLIAKYVLTYGQYHIFTSNNIVVKLKTSLLNQKPKESSEFMLIINKYVNRQIYHGVGQIYQFEAVQAEPCCSETDPVDYGLVMKCNTQTNVLNVCCCYYTNFEVTTTQVFQPYTTIKLDLLNNKIHECNIQYSPIGEIIQQMEINNNIRMPLSSQAGQQNKIVEYLVAIQIKVDNQIRIQLSISRSTSRFYETLKMISESRVFVQINKKAENSFTDERQNLIIVNINLPIVFQAIYDTNKQLIGNVQLPDQNKLNLIEFDTIIMSKLNLPNIIQYQDIDQNKFKTEKTITKFKLSADPSASPTPNIESNLFESVIVEGSQCLCFLSQNHNFQWCCQITQQVQFDGALQIKMLINEQHKNFIEIMQQPDTLFPDFHNTLINTYQNAADSVKIFNSVISAYKLKKLSVDAPIDLLMNTYGVYLSKSATDENSVHIPQFQVNQEFEINISKCLIFYINNFVLIPQDMTVERVTNNDSALPVFTNPSSAFDQNIFVQQIRSSVIDSNNVDIKQYSNKNSAANSYARSFDQHNLLQINDVQSNLTIQQGDKPQGLEQFNVLNSEQKSIFCLDSQAITTPNFFGQHTIKQPNSLFDTHLNAFSMDPFNQPVSNSFNTMPVLKEQLPAHIFETKQTFLQNDESKQQPKNVEVDLKDFKLKDIPGYVRYHFPNYNIAIIAFCDPFYRQDSWKHALAIWYLPDSFKNFKLRRNKNNDVQISSDNKGEHLYIARALVKCTVHLMDINSGIYIVDEAELIDYQDPCDKFKQHNQTSIDATVEGSVYWQEIPQNGVKKGASFGFVRLASGHERHFYLKDQKPVLGHLVKLKLFNNDNVQHPNSCELIQTLLPPPDRHKWLFGRVVQIFTDINPRTEKTLTSSFRTNTSIKQNDSYRIVNGMILTEPMQGTHVDLCFFRLVLPVLIIQQLKPGLGIFFTLKELALHKVVDETDSVYQTPVQLINDVIKQQSTNINYQKTYQQNDSDIGNSAKLSCWAVDNLCLQNDQFDGFFKQIPQRKCSGLQAEQSFFSKYGQILLNGKDSLIYVPRPTLNISPPIFKENDKFIFNVHFVFNEQRSGFTPESNQIKKIKSNITTRRIKGKILLLNEMQRCPIYVFKPIQNNANNRNVQMVDEDVGNVITCLSDQLTPEDNCYMIKTNAFYLLTYELMNKIVKQTKQLSMNQFKLLFQKLLNGEVDIYLKQVSIGLISDGEFERYEGVNQIIQQFQKKQSQLQNQIDQQNSFQLSQTGTTNVGNQYFNNTSNIFTGKDDQGNRRMLFWCRYVEELCLGEQDFVISENENDESLDEQIAKAEIDFLKY